MGTCPARNTFFYDGRVYSLFLVGSVFILSRTQYSLGLERLVKMKLKTAGNLGNSGEDG